MNLAPVFNLHGYNINASGIFFVVAFFLLSFVVWDESKRNGFAEEKSFDLLLISTLSGILFGRIFFAILNGAGTKDTFLHLIKLWTSGIDIFGYFFGVLLAVFILTRRWKWSIYRILDIYSLSYSLGAAILTLSFVGLQKRFEFLFLFSGYIMIFALLSKFKKALFRSGTIFSAFLLLNVVIGAIFYRDIRHLIFYIILVTLSLVNIYYRNKRSVMKAKISPEFLKNLTQKLTNKNKELDETQELLKSEDPYMADGRDDSNAEYMEDAILEDQRKTDIDAQMGIISRMKKQVNKALSRIHSGEYGICEVCGQPIDQARLEAYPEATTCVLHAEK